MFLYMIIGGIIVNLVVSLIGWSPTVRAILAIVGSLAGAGIIGIHLDDLKKKQGLL
jgi:FtsH-binding integral membrane protein